MVEGSLLGPAQARTPPRGLVILGHPVAQSLSPVFQGAALAAAGLGLTYERWDTPPAALDAVLAACAARELAGNITAPLKELVAARARRLTDVAARTGAVNTFWFEDGALVGHNTDVDGVRATLEALCPGRSLGRVVILGAGGAAAAVLVALESFAVTQLALVARTPARADALLERVGISGEVHADGSATAAAALREADLVVNATSVGLIDDAPPAPIERLGRHAAVFDLVYRAHGTPWTRLARAQGHRAEDGLRMLVEQGVAAFTAWFGVVPSREAMWQALGRSGPPEPGATA